MKKTKPRRGRKDTPEIEIKFRNAPSVLLEQRELDVVCLELSKLIKRTNKAVATIAGKYGVIMTAEIYFSLTQGTGQGVEHGCDQS